MLRFFLVSQEKKIDTATKSSFYYLAETQFDTNRGKTVCSHVQVLPESSLRLLLVRETSFEFLFVCTGTPGSFVGLMRLGFIDCDSRHLGVTVRTFVDISLLPLADVMST